MATHRTDPFLWFHLAALAAVPLGLEGCLVGLAVGDPLLPGSLDCLLVGVLGAVPLLALQWFRPIYPFSMPLVSLRPASLSPRQLKILTIAQSLGAKIAALAAAIAGLALLQLVYQWAPIATEVTRGFLATNSRLAGLGIAIAAFFFTSLWLQMSLGSALVLITPGGMVKRTEGFPGDRINQSFFRWGIPLRSILPTVEEVEELQEIEELEKTDGEDGDENRVGDQSSTVIEEDVPEREIIAEDGTEEESVALEAVEEGEIEAEAEAEAEAGVDKEVGGVGEEDVELGVEEVEVELVEEKPVEPEVIQAELVVEESGGGEGAIAPDSTTSNTVDDGPDDESDDKPAEMPDTKPEDAEK